MTSITYFLLGIVVGALIVLIIMWNSYNNMFADLTDTKHELLMYKLRKLRGDNNGKID